MSAKEQLKALLLAREQASGASPGAPGGGGSAKERLKAILRAREAGQGVQQAQAPPPDDPSLLQRVHAAISGATNAVERGFMQGARDEMAGLSAGTLALFTDEDFSDAYARARDRERKEGKEFAQRNPTLNTALEMTGALATGGPMVNAIKAAPSLVGTIARSAGTGAAYGGVSGFASAEGGVENRLEKGGTGVMLGGTIGGLTPAALKAGGAVVKTLAKPIANRVNPHAHANREILKALQRDGLTPAQATARLEQMGPDAVLADLGENMRGLAGTVARMPGETKQRAAQMMSGRGGRIASDAADTVESALAGGKDFRKAIDELAEQRANAARPLYDRVVRAENVVPEQRFAEIAGDGHFQQLIRQVKADKLAKLDNLPDNSMPVLDAAYKRLEDQVSRSIRSGTNNRTRQLQEQLVRLRGAIDDVFPDYQMARDAWAAHSRSIQALERGRAFVKGDADMFAEEIARMAPADREFLRIGVARGLRDQLERSSNGVAKVRQWLSTPGINEKLSAVFPDRESHVQFQRALENGLEKAKLPKAVLGGSPTQQRLAEEADLGTAVDAASALSGSGVGLSGLFRAGQQFMRRAGLPETVRNDIGRGMLSLSGTGAGDLRLSQLSRMLDKDAAKRLRFERVAMALAGVEGQQVGLR